MKIIRLKAKNFKSFDPSGIDFKMDLGLNVIVGENNVGKSNIGKILVELKELLEKPNEFNSAHAFHGNLDNDFELEINFELESEDITFLMHQFSVPNNSEEEFLNIFGEEVKITFQYTKYRGSQVFIRFGNMNIHERQGSYENPENARGRGYHPVNWQNVVNSAGEENVALHFKIFETLQTEAESDGAEARLEFPRPPRQIFARLFREKIIIFPEFRDRPTSNVDPGLLSSPEGTGVASVLFNLKNGSIDLRNRFKTIQEHFTQIYPSLKLDVRNGHQIVVVKSDMNEIDQESIGAGIIEIIILLTHLTETKNHVFVLDEPELHLHPHAKRSVSDLIRKAEINNQILCITHSTNFIYPDILHKTTLVKDVKGSSKLVRLNRNSFSEMELKKILKYTTSQQKEFFFARAVLLVEGDTEASSIPILAKKIDQDLNLHNISVISVDSHHFALFVKILRGFDIPYKVMLDEDTISNIEESIEINSKKVKTSSLIKQLNDLGEIDDADKKIIKTCEKGISKKNDHFKYDEKSVKQLRAVIKKHKFIYLLPSDYEGLFKNSSYNKLKTTAKKEFKGNKVLQGKYIAENLEEIPDDLVEVIDKTVMLTQ